MASAPTPEVHLAVAQREDPAVAGKHRAGVRAQLQVRGDPRLVGARRAQVGRAATPYTVSRCQVRPSARPRVDRAPSATIRCRQDTRWPAVGQHHRRHPPGRIPFGVNGFAAQQHRGPGFLGNLAHPIVELDPRYRGTGSGKRRPRPWHLDRAAEPVQPQPVVADPAVEPVAQSEAAQLHDGARGQPVAAGLVAGNSALSTTRTSRPARAARRGRGPRRTGPDDDHLR